ncbi:hypothetical protein TSUD_271760 [Trifolium subterraneum]|uniref:GH3 C-terminal domain-containing protein n=1 Tax=Trifolium subterraneum TaxID=3900 RepID=A0A2Z6PDA5_TRISU|nr:hypothetical protein TSUD_271760 [Trifolium subterraneum]
MQARRCGRSGRISQWDPKIELHMQKKTNPNSKHRQKYREGPTISGRESYADVTNQPGHYVIYWEIKGEVEDNILDACCREMDLSFADHGYVVSRKTNSIGPLELCILESGAFKKILDNFISNGVALNQFKTPRCTNNHVLLKILDNCTTKRFLSTAYSLD